MQGFQFSKFFGLLLMVFVFSQAYAGDSTDISLRTLRVTAQTQQPTTVVSTAQSFTVRPDQDGKVSCPPGYALTNLNSSGETHVNVSVYTECNGVGAYYVHTWCKNGEKRYRPTSHAPTVSYTCQKIQNRWVPA